MEPAFLILGTVAVAGAVTLFLKAALSPREFPPQVEIGAFAVILLIFLLAAFGIWGP